MALAASRPDAALETAACHCPAISLHFYFFNKVFDALMQMSEAVNLIVAQLRNQPEAFLGSPDCARRHM